MKNLQFPEGGGGEGGAATEGEKEGATIITVFGGGEGMRAERTGCSGSLTFCHALFPGPYASLSIGTVAYRSGLLGLSSYSFSPLLD